MLGALPRPFPNPGPTTSCRIRPTSATATRTSSPGSRLRYDARVLDARRDDYTATRAHGGRPDALPRPRQAALTVTVSRTAGSGRVVERARHTRVSGTCTLGFDPGASVTLRAEPDTGARLGRLGWRLLGPRELCRATRRPAVGNGDVRPSDLPGRGSSRGQGRVRSRPVGISPGSMLCRLPRGHERYLTGNAGEGLAAGALEGRLQWSRRLRREGRRQPLDRCDVHAPTLTNGPTHAG